MREGEHISIAIDVIGGAREYPQATNLRAGKRAGQTHDEHCEHGARHGTSGASESEAAQRGGQSDLWHDGTATSDGATLDDEPDILLSSF